MQAETYARVVQLAAVSMRGRQSTRGRRSSTGEMVILNNEVSYSRP